MEDKYFCINETNKAKIHIIQSQKDEYYKNLSLFMKFEKTLDKYLRKLMESSKEYNIYNYNLRTKIYALEKDIRNLTNRKEYLENEKLKYQNIKKMLISAKYGSKALAIKDNNKEEKSIFLTETNVNIDKNSIKKRSSLTNNFSKEKKIRSNKKIMSNKNISEKNEKIFIRRYNSTEVIDSKSLVPKFTRHFGLNNIFDNFENSIINSLYSFNNKKNEIHKLEMKLKESKKFVESEHSYHNMITSSKAMKLFFLKRENKVLNTRFNSIKKETALNDGFMIKLEEKIYNIIININKEMNIQEKINIKDLSQLSELKYDEFYNKMKINKVLYMIKIMELFSSFLINLTNKYSNEPKLNEKYKEVINRVEKEKNEKNREMNRERIRQRLEDNKNKYIKKYNQIRFFNYKRYDVKPKKNKGNINQKVFKQKKETKIDYEPWLTYT